MKNKVLLIFSIFLVLLMVFVLGSIIGVGYYLGISDNDTDKVIKVVEREDEYTPVLDHEKAVINVVEESSSAVVSIVASKYVERMRFPFEEFFGMGDFDYEEEVRERLETGEGTGFIISSDGIILTNKHVVRDENAEYSVFLSDGTKYDGEVLGRDPVHDIAILKIEGKSFPTVKIGDSDNIRIGQTAIAIGNALGEFENTVSVGVISGLGRRVVAHRQSQFEVLDNVVQTDAAINLGNSGGPLLNLNGEVVAVNTATAVHAEGIGFAIPINKAKRAIDGVLEHGEIVYPFLGVRYIMVNEDIARERGLAVDYGAVIVFGGRGQEAIEKGSAAEKVGLKEGDIILKIDGKKITENNPLSRVIVSYYPGDEVDLTIFREGRKKNISVVLGRME